MKEFHYRMYRAWRWIWWAVPAWQWLTDLIAYPMDYHHDKSGMGWYQ